MTTTTGQHRSKTDPRLPQLQRAVAERLAATEYDRVADTLEALRPEQWGARPTAQSGMCARWPGTCWA